MKKNIIPIVLSLALLMSCMLFGCDNGKTDNSPLTSTVTASTEATGGGDSTSALVGSAEDVEAETENGGANDTEVTSFEAVTSDGASSNILDTTEPTVYLKAKQSGDTVTVTGYVKNNPGIAGMSIRVEYDSTVVTPKTITGKLMTVTSNLQQEGIELPGYVTVVYVSADGITDNGELFNITFKKKSTGTVAFKLMAGENSFVSPSTEYVKVNAVGNAITIV